jgi:hypothetical protein
MALINQMPLISWRSSINIFASLRLSSEQLASVYKSEANGNNVFYQKHNCLCVFDICVWSKIQSEQKIMKSQFLNFYVSFSTRKISLIIEILKQ